MTTDEAVHIVKEQIIGPDMYRAVDAMAAIQGVESAVAELDNLARELAAALTVMVPRCRGCWGTGRVPRRWALTAGAVLQQCPDCSQARQ